MISFVHSMKWGAEVAGDGVRFRLWAPTVERVDMVVERNGAPAAHAMERGEAGWWQLHVSGFGAGVRYRYRIDDELSVPDPASRYQPEDCHGPSEVVDPASYAWQHGDWRGRPWHEAVVYELHLGTFTPEGTCRAAIDRLGVLVDLGITVVELMPVADFPGGRNWGYDGVLPFAPDSSYGTPDDLKSLVDAAHGLGLMVLLDVVYNHFGPEGNYLGRYAAPFFTHRHQTPWGDAINYDTGSERVQVRDFFIDNALYWLEEFRFDGLRLDAVHAIRDDSAEHVLAELARRVRQGPGAERHVHLVLENDDNEARWLDDGYEAQWNDDIHHAFHVTLTGEADSYYGDYADAPVARLARCLAQGFDYQGEHSLHRDEPRGESSGHLPPTAFVNFLQNHDQVGNRALGERIHELTGARPLRAATELLLLSPMPPLLFMGQEWCASSRFPFFCDFGNELAEAVVEGRLREFSRFEAFRDPRARQRIPSPVSRATFESAKLSWDERLAGDHGEWWRLFHDLLALRRRHLVPLLSEPPGGRAEMTMRGQRAFQVTWHLGAGAHYTVTANLGDVPAGDEQLPAGSQVYATPDAASPGTDPWSTLFTLQWETAEPSAAGGAEAAG